PERQVGRWEGKSDRRTIRAKAVSHRRAASTSDMCLTTYDKSFIVNRYARRGETMAKPTASFAALPIAYVVLRLLIVVNWLMGAAILALLVIMPNEQWIMAAFKLSPSADAEP